MRSTFKPQGALREIELLGSVSHAYEGCGRQVCQGPARLGRSNSRSFMAQGYRSAEASHNFNRGTGKSKTGQSQFKVPDDGGDHAGWREEEAFSRRKQTSRSHHCPESLPGLFLAHFPVPAFWKCTVMFQLSTGRGRQRGLPGSRRVSVRRATGP